MTPAQIIGTHILAVAECERENRYYSLVRGYQSTYYRAGLQWHARQLKAGP